MAGGGAGTLSKKHPEGWSSIQLSVSAQVMTSRFREFKPRVGLCADSVEPAWDPLSLSLSLPLHHSLRLRLKINKKKSTPKVMYLQPRSFPLDSRRRLPHPPGSCGSPHTHVRRKGQTSPPRRALGELPDRVGLLHPLDTPRISLLYFLQSQARREKSAGHPLSPPGGTVRSTRGARGLLGGRAGPGPWHLGGLSQHSSNA